MRGIVAPALIALAIVAQGCRSAETAETASDLRASPPLEDTRWTLVEVSGEPVATPNGEDEAYLRLLVIDHEVEGYTGCNRMMGGYVLAGRVLKLPGLASTRRYCEATTATEQAFMAALSQTTEYRISGSVLELIGDGKTVAKLENR